MLNSTNHIGRIITELKPKITNSGAPTLSFRIACDRDYVKPGENRQSDIFSVVAYNNDANFIADHFCKGAMIGITGRLETYSHPTKEGKNYASVYIKVESASFTGERREKDPTLFDNKQS
ncbi:MAG: single-stranded DNA-binding protein [Ruminococcus sp.]|nr:single-stranded DNA-binding protein [Ruminococcus sp.]MBQ4129604.1 single-stranded DNA-binding protein [Ruminococcus sp.]